MCIYESSAEGVFYSPFDLSIEPMERLLLVNIEKDPDEVYIGFEPQVFDDEYTGSGMLVIAYRADGFVDVYHEPGLKMESKDYSVVGKGAVDTVETVFERSLFSIGEMGANVDIAFQDKAGRPIRIRILEHGTKPARPFALLAPLGDSTEQPSVMPLFFIYDFYFVRRANTDFVISVDGKEHRPDKFPFPMDGSRIYFTRYSGAPLIARWNEARHGPLEPHRPSGDRYRIGDTEYDLVRSNDHIEIAAMRAGYGGREVEIRFEPAVPDVAKLRDGAVMSGIFQVLTDPSAGNVSGTWMVSRRGEETFLRIHPSKGWAPDVRRGMPRWIFRFARVFRSWPTTYIWEAQIRADEDGRPMLESSWRRISG